MFDRTKTREAAIAVGLTAITGYVDAVSFTRLFDVFPANQTGNVVLFGIAVGDPGRASAWRSGLAMVAFFVGVAVAFALATRIPDRIRVPSLLGVETIGLAVFTSLAGDLHDRHGVMTGASCVAALGIAALMMGIQTDTLRLASGVKLSTTYETGAMVEIAETVTDSAFRSALPTPQSRRMVVLLLTVIVAYAAGAAAGARVASWWGGALWIPVLLASALAVVTAVAPLRVKADPVR